MPITTFYSEWELPAMSSVEDPALNEIFQEVRSKVSNDYYVLSHAFPIREKWYKKRKMKTFYGVRVRVGHEFQVLNFCPPDHEHHSINTLVKREVVYAYFMGILANKTVNNL